MLREPLITSVTQSKVRSMIHKVMSFLVSFAKRAPSKAEGGEESARKLQKSFSDEWELAVTRNSTMREQIPRKIIPVNFLGKRRISSVRQLVHLQKVWKMDKTQWFLQTQGIPLQKKKPQLLYFFQYRCLNYRCLTTDA